MKTRSQGQKPALQRPQGANASGSHPRDSKRKISYKDDSSSENSEQHIDIGEVQPGSLHSKHKSKKQLSVNIRFGKMTALPFHVLLCIFQFAAQLLLAEHFKFPVQWLLNMALVCKTFTEPAMSTLYWSPYLGSSKALRKFLVLLGKDPKTTFTNYLAKVKVFDIENAYQLKADVVDIIRHFPTLKGIGNPYYQDDRLGRSRLHGSSRRSKRPLYAPLLFQTFSDCTISLKSWTWNFCAEFRAKYPWDSLASIHSGAYFRHLRTMSLRNYDGCPESESLASALVALPCLVKLSFTAPLDLSSDFWPSLPFLECLKIVESEIKTEEVLSYLKSKGRRLRELVLGRNPMLDFDFCADLARCCPELTKLYLDGQRAKTRVPFASLKESQLFVKSNVPTWPSTLQEIKLVNLGRLDNVLAEVLFKSILDAALSLQDLRELVIKASVYMPHRERALFRRRWVCELETAYLRKCEDPGTTSASATDARRSIRLVGDASTPNSASTMVQGLCNIVDVRIDNQRPIANTQFTENDFMDSEASEDSEYTG